MALEPLYALREETADEDSKMNGVLRPGVEGCIARYDSNLKATIQGSSQNRHGSQVNLESDDSQSVSDTDSEKGEHITSDSSEVEAQVIKNESSSAAAETVEWPEEGSDCDSSDTDNDISMEKPSSPPTIAVAATQPALPTPAASVIEKRLAKQPVTATPVIANGHSPLRAEATPAVVMSTSTPALAQPGSESRLRKRTHDVQSATVDTPASSAPEKKSKTSAMDPKLSQSTPKWLAFARGQCRPALVESSQSVPALVESSQSVPAPVVHEPIQKATHEIQQAKMYPVSDELADSLDGRLYRQLEDTNGKLVSSQNVPLPTGYEIQADSALQFYCPVKLCNKRYKGIAGLANHFNALHGEQALRDNCDGTFTIVGKFARAASDPIGIVVERNTASLSKKKGKDKQPEGHAQTSFSRQVTVTGKRFNSEVFNHVQSSLGKNAKIPDMDGVYRMASMRRRRSLTPKWIDFFANRKITPLQYAYSVAYLTGQSVDSGMTCQKQHGDQVLFSESVAVPQSLSAQELESLGSYKGCASCLLHSAILKKQVDCDWKGFAPKKQAIVITTPPQADTASQPASNVRQATDGGQLSATDGDTLVVKQPTTKPAVKKQPKTAKKQTKQPKKQQKQQKPKAGIPTPSHSAEESHDDTTMADVSKTLVEHTLTDGEPGKEIANPSARHHQGTFSPELDIRPSQGQEDDLEMETWERAPGRVQDGAQKNLAFSNSYITGDTLVPVAPDVSVNVVNIAPGKYHRWTESPNKIRVCFVSSGKVKARVAATEFRLGQNGVFTVSPNQPCVVENRFYTDAVIQCTTIDNYQLIPRAEQQE